MQRRIVLIAAVLLLLAPGAWAKTTLDVQVGWGNTMRIGRWTPVTVTLADPDGPDAIVEAMSSHDQLYGVKITQYLGTLSTTPKQFQLLVPIESASQYGSDPVWLVIRNAKTGKLLAKTDPEDSSRPRLNAQLEIVNGSNHMLGISGDKTRLSDLRGLVPNARLSVDHMELRLLPIAPIGYDMLDVLILNAPDLNELSEEQQRAIVSWVTAGGNLLMWPSEAPPPQGGPLIELLPCEIGNIGITDVPPETLARVTLPKRFGRLPSRALTPAHGGEAVQLFGDDTVIGYQRSAGLGKVLVSPVNLSQLQFDEAKQTWAVWSRALGSMIDLPADALTNTNNYNNPYGNPADETAKQQIADVLGTVPGTGSFGFSYVAIVLIGMMVIVGPVDWFVLRMLKKQAWTWVTTSGWIALVTLGAIYIGNVVKSGDLHLRTFTLIDQADGATVARQEMVGIYSPRTADYNVAVQPMGWWQPFAPGMNNYYGYNRNQFSNQIDFHQTYHDNQPGTMQINVWSLRFLEGQTIEPGPAMLEASLKRELRAGGTYIVGTVKNLTDHPLRGLRILRSDTQATLAVVGIPGDATIAPGAVANVEGLLDRKRVENEDRVVQYGYGYGGSAGVANPDALWNASTLWGGDRTRRINALIGDAKHVCLLAGVENPTPAATLDAGPAQEQHWQIIRAVVPID